MFDTYVTRQQPNYPQTVNKNVTINENRAPTDQSVELLGEMQQKVLEGIVGKIKIESNIINDVEGYLRDDPYRCAWVFSYKYAINGYEFTDEISFDQYDMYGKTNHEIVEKIGKKFNEHFIEVLSKKIIFAFMNSSDTCRVVGELHQKFLR